MTTQILSEIKTKLDSITLDKISVRNRLSVVKNTLNSTFSTLSNECEEVIIDGSKILKGWLDYFSESNLTKLKNWFKGDRANLRGVVNLYFDGDLADKVYNILNLSKDDWYQLKSEKREIIDDTEELVIDWQKYLETTERLLKSKSWRENYAGLVACLGRRPTEYLDNDAFSLVEDEDGYKLFFNNQLKKKGTDFESYEISTIFNNTNEIYQIWLDFIENLEVKTKLAQIESAISTDLDEDVRIVKLNELKKERFNHIVNEIIKENFDWLAVTPQTKEVSCKVLRRCYASLAVSLSCPITKLRTCENEFKRLLGHSVNENSVTVGYKDYQLMPEIFGKIFEFSNDVIIEKNLEELLSMSTIARLKKLSVENNVSIDDLINRLLDVQENDPNGLFEEVSLESVKGNQAPFSAFQKVSLAARKIMKHNDCQETENKYPVTVRNLLELSGSRHEAVKKYVDQNFDEIEKHHQKHGLNAYSSKGKPPIKEVIM